jgi:PKD repeat protein
MRQFLSFLNKKSLSWSMTIALLFLLNGCFTTSSDPIPSSSSSGGNSSKPAPTPIFTYSIGQNGSVTFTNLSINATDYVWDFGDNLANSVEMNPTHHFLSNNTFNVSLAATGPGGTKSISNKVTITNVQGSITYYNTTQTSLTITVNGQTQTAATNASVTFYGSPNSTATGTALAFGTTSNGAQVGLKLSISINDTFTATGKSVNLQIGSSFFFLQLKNSWTYPITKVYINYGLADQTLDNITIPNDGQTYGLGYYKGLSNSNVRFENGTHIWSSNIYPGNILPNTVAFLEVK